MALAMMMAGMFGTAHAYTYEYTGKPFTQTLGSYTTSDFLIVDFTISTLLPADFTGDISNSLTWIRYDKNTGTPFKYGVDTASFSGNEQTSIFIISTDSAGLPTQWSFQGYDYSGIDPYATSFTSSSISLFDEVDAYFLTHVEWGYSSVLGTWRLLDPPGTASVPEPSTIILLGLGLGGLAACRFRSRK
ncbi:MAG TPA: PEP-CTERM sorting domain-containing protein [Geobacteraceae bacterium]